ncbi:MAG: DUF167 domain-containing protein [Methanoregulaceae archaeon]|nr:DUF167 domain-containing protein [Methanoregulaceae archaeon]
MGSLPDALCVSSDGVILTLEVSPGSDEDLFPSRFNEWRNAIGCRVKAPAEHGKANRAVLSIVASVLNIQETNISLLGGGTSTIKRVMVRHISRDKVLSILGDLLDHVPG